LLLGRGVIQKAHYIHYVHLFVVLYIEKHEETEILIKQRKGMIIKVKRRQFMD
jgi:hypothetical protein